MKKKLTENRADLPEDKAGVAGNDETDAKAEAEQPAEVGGRGGLDPTRYGDWEKDGRCIDF